MPEGIHAKDSSPTVDTRAYIQHRIMHSAWRDFTNAVFLSDAQFNPHGDIFHSLDALRGILDQYAGGCNCR